MEHCPDEHLRTPDEHLQTPDEHLQTPNNAVVSKILNATCRDDRLLSVFLKQLMLDVIAKISHPDLVGDIFVTALHKAVDTVNRNLD